MAHPKSQQLPMTNIPWTQVQKMVPSPFLEEHPTPLNSKAGGG